MQTFGLIGGIASGKSTVAEMFCQLGAVRIDADQLGHLALLMPEVKSKIRKRWGDSVFDSGGNPDRKKIAALVFEPTDKGRQELLFLQELTHPVIGTGIAAHFRECEMKKIPLVLLDAPLLLEAGWDGLVDKIIFIEAPRLLRLSRAISRGWTEQEFTARENVQLPVEKKQVRADITINNSGTPEETLEQVKKMVTGSQGQPLQFFC